MIILFAYLFLALAVSFLCSILEASLLSMPPSFVRQQESAGAGSGRLLAQLKANIDRPLAAILSLNTIAHTIGAAGVGAQAVAIFGQAYFGIISAILTLLILFLSEIIPKTLGAQHWRSISRFTAYSCKAIIIAAYPLVWLSERVTRFFQPSDAERQSVSRDEFVALAQLGRNEGVLADNEMRIIRNLVRFRNLRVESIMTPRTVLAMLPDQISCDSAMSQSSVLRFSRIPLYSDNKDNIVGYALKSEIFHRVASGRGETPILDLKRPLRHVSELDSLSKLFDELLSHNEQIALVLDEYGATRGVVTLEDLIETLIGLEIVDELDSEVDMRELARRKWDERAKRIGIVENGENA